MKSPNRKHDRSSFYKYIPASTAEIVLNNRTLRWTSPIEFNDPFDVPRELAVNISPAEIQKALVEMFVELIESPPEHTEGLDCRVRVILEAVKQGGTDELKAQLIAGLRAELETGPPPSQGLVELQNLWRACLPQFRILCLSENHDRASMWYHYADKYQGVVLEVLCNDELDSAWLAAEKVQYPVEKPHVYSATGWAKLLSMPQAEAIQTIMHTCSYTKSPDWSYENEWRISSFKRANEAGTISDYKLAPEEFGRLYIGPHIRDTDRAKLLIAANKYPNIKVFETSIGLDREFNFIEISG